MNFSHELHLINPSSGSGRFLKKTVDRLKIQHIDHFISKDSEDLRQHITEYCIKYPDSHIVSYGGDGTVNDTVNAIMQSGSQTKCAFSVVPMGSGNDFVRHMTHIYDPKDTSTIHPVDLIKAGNTYIANMINIGFDCNTVAAAGEIRKKHISSGSFSYILGVLSTLRKKETFNGTIVCKNVIDIPTGSMKEDIAEKGTFLLCAVANGRFCGGGFDAAPIAEENDGFADILIVRDITRRNFLGLVPSYKKGTHICKDGVPVKSFFPILKYVRCSSMDISGMKLVCFDGEIESSDSLHIDVVHDAVNYVAYNVS